MLLMASAASAQVTVEARIDSLQLLIGEQAKIKLEVSMDAGQKLQLPFLKDTLVRGVEILDIAKPDTQLLNDKKRWLISQEYTVTSFARALIRRPALILADEPTGSLDPDATQEILSLLEDLHRAGQTILLITHNPTVAARAERRLTLQGGKIVEEE